MLHTLCLAFLLVPLAYAQECDLARQVAFQVGVTVDDVTPFIALEPPASCEGFQLLELLVCQDDINIKEGCCTTGCKDMLKKVNRQCLTDLTDLGCEEGAASLIPYLDTLVARCVEGDPLPLACDATTTRVELAASDSKGTCSEDRVVADEPVEIDALAPLITLEIPPSCEGFSLASLFTCQDEINIVEGCCEDKCKEVFDLVSRQCLEDMGYLVCTSGSSDAFSILNGVAQRCHSDPPNVDCAELIARGPPIAMGPATEFIAEELLEPEAGDVIDDSVEKPLSSPESGPAPEEAEEEQTFFGVSDVSATETDEETFFGVQNAPADIASNSSEGSCENAEVDENIDVNNILEVLSATNIDKCPGFGSDTFTCSSDITLITDSACCEKKCRSFMEALSDECIEEVLRVSCSQSEIDTHTIFERTAKRCLAGYTPRTCEELNSKNAAGRITIIGSVFGGLLLAAILLI